MSLTKKDLVVGGVTATALVGTIVYMQYKFGKIEEEMNELRKESKNLAQYIELLEAKIANDLNARGSYHQVRAPPNQPAGPTVADPPVQATPSHHAQPTHSSHGHNHAEHSNHHGHQHQHSHEQPGSHAVREPARNVREPARVNHRQPPAEMKAAKSHHIVAQEHEQQEDDDAQEDVPTPPVSNRRQIPRAAQVPMRNTRPVAKPVEEEKPESERRPIAVASTGRPPAPSANGRKPPGSGPDKPKKFLPKDSDEIAIAPASSKRNGSKSILKTGQSSDIDPDLLADIESTAKSGKRNDNEKEGRVDSQSAAKERMTKTREIAAAIQKKREAEVAALPGGGGK